MPLEKSSGDLGGALLTVDASLSPNAAPFSVPTAGQHHKWLGEIQQ